MQERRFCCDTKNDEETFDDCEWFDSLGPIPGGAVTSCQSGCPSNRVRVAMDQLSRDCYGKVGAKARCCVPRHSETIEVVDDELEKYRIALMDYMKDPTCPSGGFGLNARALGSAGNASQVGSVLEARADKSSVEYIYALLLALVTTTQRNNLYSAMEDLWNSEIGDEFDHLRMPALGRVLKKLPAYKTSGPKKICGDIICSPNYWDRRAEGGAGFVDCSKALCGLGGCDDNALGSRGVATASLGGTVSWQNMHTGRSALEKRVAAPRKYELTLESSDGSESVFIIISLPGVRAIAHASARPSRPPLSRRILLK